MSSPGNRLFNYTIYFGTGRVMGVYRQYRNHKRWFLNIRETPHKRPTVSAYEFTWTVVLIFSTITISICILLRKSAVCPSSLLNRPISYRRQNASVPGHDHTTFPWRRYAIWKRSLNIELNVNVINERCLTVCAEVILMRFHTCKTF